MGNNSLIMRGICLEVVANVPKKPADNSICCSICKLWFHVCCTNITEEQFINDDIWICPFCQT